jgi:lipopolysaccharide biosynthesis protein
LAYEYICHIHTKKSIASNSIGDVWRKYLWNGLLSNHLNNVEKILGLLKTYALVYPQKFHWIDVINCQWGLNFDRGVEICHNAGIPPPHKGYVEFPVGAMFWARTECLSPLLRMNLTSEDFDEELGQTDQTLAHTLERLIGYAPLAQGKKIAIIKNPLFLNHYP